MDTNFHKAFSPNHYIDKKFNMQAVKILPGEYFATKNNTLIVTVLGSCISVCLRDSLTGIAGMNHFLLPSSHLQQTANIESARYGVNAMEILVNHMIKLGAPKHRLEAKIFGGASVLRNLKASAVGQLNANFVINYLTAEHIKIIAQDLLGEYPRKIYFFPETGEVKVRKLKSMHNSTILERESEYHSKVNRQASFGDVDLFR